jgi:hypothetical protein
VSKHIGFDQIGGGAALVADLAKRIKKVAKKSAKKL